MGCLMDTLLLLAVVVVLLLGGFACVFLLSKALEDLKDSFKQPPAQKMPDFETLKADLMDMVADTIGTMQPPNAMDHLMGMITQFAQMKMMQATGINPADIMGHVTELTEGLNDPPE